MRGSCFFSTAGGGWILTLSGSVSSSAPCEWPLFVGLATSFVAACVHFVCIFSSCAQR